MKMNNTKLHRKWIAVAAALVILLLVAACSGEQPEELAASVPEPTVQTTATEARVTEPTSAATAPGEETEPAQTTAATESASASNVDANVDLTYTSDEILARYPAIEDFGEEPEEEDSGETSVEIPAPGTQKNPYVEMLAAYPAQVLSVSIPAGQSASYLILGSAGTVVSVDDPAITLTQGDQAAAVSETDSAALDLGNAVDDPVICLSNTGAEAKSCTVNLVEALGVKNNPEPVTDLNRIAVKLAAGDLNGHHYLWTAAGAGQLTLSTESEILEIMLPDYGELLVPAAEGPENINLRVEGGEKLLIHAMAIAGEDGVLPEVETEILLQWVPDAQVQAASEPAAAAAEDSVIIADPAAPVALPSGTGETAAAEVLLLSLRATEAAVLFNDAEYPVVGDAATFCFRWTALRSGTLSVVLEGESSWEYVLTDQTTGINLVGRGSLEAIALLSHTLEIREGDELCLILNSAPPVEISVQETLPAEETE